MIRKIFGLLGQIRLKAMSPAKRAIYMRKKMYHVGNNVLLYPTYFGTEPYLISIHDNVICAAGVSFYTHDMSSFVAARYLGREKPLDKVGSIELFDNCFIGAQTILMPNTSVGENSIVAAGSVVTKHIPANEVWGGVPAHFIMTTKQYCDKLLEIDSKYPWLDNDLWLKDNVDIVAMRQEYFFKKQ